MRKVELLPTRDCEAGYGPGFTVSQLSRRDINPQQSHKRTINRHDSRERSNNVSRDKRLRGMSQEPL